MALPVNPIEIWAVDDYTLPNAHTKNKIRPINDLWAKGYDKGQRPDVQAWNYVWYNSTAWIKYISEEQIPGLDERFLKISLNLSDVPDKAAALTNLGAYSKTQADSKFVDVTGDTMSGPLTAPQINFAASNSDFAYVTTTNPSPDVTYFDFVVGDNTGVVGVSPTDSMRFRFAPVGASAFTMLELNALSNTVAQARLTGNFIASGSVTASSLTVNGLAAVASLSVSSNTATVGGRNVVRSVNGQVADGNGDLSLTIPSQGVQDMRQSGEIQIANTQFVPFSQGRAGIAPVGAFVTGVADYKTSKIWIEDVDVVFYRYLQKQIDGVWYNIGT